MPGPPKVVLWTLTRVRPYERNPRDYDETSIAAVAASIEQFGFLQPIVVDAEGVIIVGHVRYHAAKKLGLERVPVLVATHLSPDEARAYRIADNKTGELSDWNYELLPLELADLRAANYELGLLGFDEAELASLLAPLADGLCDPDEIPEPPAKAVTQPGDLWLLGEHRLLCGDSAAGGDVDRLLAGEPIHLVNTDPPYNVRVEPRSNNAIAAARGRGTHHQAFDTARRAGAGRATHQRLRPKDRPLANDFVSAGEFERLLAAWFGRLAGVLLPGRAFYIWGGYANCANYPPALAAAGLYFSQAVIWVKEHPVLTRKDFMGNHEWCFYGWREGAAHEFFGAANVPDVWELSRASAGSVGLGRGVRIEGSDGSRIDVLPPSGERRTLRVGEEPVILYGPNSVTDVWRIKKVSPHQMVHLTEKPVELAARAMEYSSRAGEHVLDLFGGSGSTLIAAQQTGRRAYLMELDPLYCDVIVERWKRFTGGKPKRVPAKTARPSRGRARQAAAATS